MRRLYFGDNLDVLRHEIASASVDLIYLDPPFNSQRDYNLLFRTPKGHPSDAQITAFEDTWRWGEQAEREYAEIMHQGNTVLSDLMAALRVFLRENDLMAYLVMMANRLIELHRVLKPTGSLYLHCDPTASHYLKILLDGIFGKENFRNEIIWHYSGWNKPLKHHFERRHDLLFYYSKAFPAFNSYFIPYSSEQEYLETRKQKVYFDEQGRKYTLDVRNKGQRRTRVYVNESLARGKPIDDVWDIDKVNNSSKESLGYPTQKPLVLLERIIQASSNQGNVVLDPFCGCGTAVHAAQKFGREWIGIDITHLAIAVIEKRLRDAFPGIAFEVHGTPKDVAGAQALAARDRYQFQWWACALVNAQPYQGKKKGADNGIDGLIYFQDERHATRKIVVSVKSGEHVTVAQVRDLAHVVSREQAAIGLFVTLVSPTEPMRVEALKAGYYESPLGKSYPRVQILTIEGLLIGRDKPAYPDLALGAHTFKKAKREPGTTEQASLL
jgi:DNA modification methylase